ncbi:hypothetical protein POF45_16960 [Pseudomonas sp. 681]|uniref:Uncharacterized protein n=1 Tax=Pseudomonas fungipugnans TaxID=3024217 RepID=A0ABT6QQD0_9PSED|nr:hypothetical protein [Pseudomonas sp. 681]MDI2593105.1 hypothetical protein [Pseudomonas sp. 681]
MKDALTAFVVTDFNDFPSLNTRSEKVGDNPFSDTFRGSKVAHKLNASTSPASDSFSSQDQYGDAQSVTAFDELDRRRADTTEIDNYICKLRALHVVKNAGRIADRIVNLLDLYKEDYDGKSLSSPSLATFTEFLILHSASKFPSITATPAGELYVQWKHSESQRLGIQFLAGSEIKWVLFKSNSVYEGRIDQFSGRTVVDSFKETATALGIHEWIVE